MKRIIGFTGNIGAGKTTAARILVEEFGFTSVNFKDGLLKEVLERFPDLLREINSYYQNLNFKSSEELIRAYPRPPLVRALLQNYGTDVRRNDFPEYWVRRWMNDTNPYEKIVVDDVRFLNEAHAIGVLAGTVYRINGKTDMSKFGGHASETEMSKIIVANNIQNHGDIESFKAQIRLIANDSHRPKIVMGGQGFP